MPRHTAVPVLLRRAKLKNAGARQELRTKFGAFSTWQSAFSQASELPRIGKTLAGQVLSAASLPRVISVPGLHNQVLLLRHQADLVIAGFGVAFVGSVAQVVLGPQLLGDAVINLINRLLFRNFVETTAGFPRNLIENFLAIDAGFLLRSPVSPAASSSRKTASGPTAAVSAHSAASGAAKAVAVFVFIGKQDGVDHSVGALGGLDGALQRLFAASVIAVGKNNQRLATLLLLHQFVRGEEDGVVKQRAPSAVHVWL